jgi:hypothetical protein
LSLSLFFTNDRAEAKEQSCGSLCPVTGLALALESVSTGALSSIASGWIVSWTLGIAMTQSTENHPEGMLKNCTGLFVCEKVDILIRDSVDFLFRA